MKIGMSTLLVPWVTDVTAEVPTVTVSAAMQFELRPITEIAAANISEAAFFIFVNPKKFSPNSMTKSIS